MQQLLFLAVMSCLCVIPTLSAQDAVKADPQHYKVVSENDQVRVVRVHYGPHEKSVMHSHPDLVMVPLNDGKVMMSAPDGTKAEREMKSGEAHFESAVTHLPENTGDQPMDVVLVELKSKAANPPAPK